MSGRVWSGRPATAGEPLITTQPNWLQRLLAPGHLPKPVPALRKEDTELVDWIAKLREGDPNPVESAHRRAAEIRARRETQQESP